VLKPSAVVELIWQDETGSTASTTLSAPSSLANEVIASDAEALGAILASLTGATLIKIRIKYVSVPEEPVTASGSTPITRTGIFFFSTGPSTPDSLVSVPSVKDSIVLDSGPSAGVGIDLSNSDVITFGAAVVDNGISNPFADDFTSLFAAYIQSRV
jgi:hypothetical protein